MTMGDRIRTRRLELNLTQQELADKLGIKSRSYISLLEKGDRNLPTSMIRKLVSALDTTPSYLLGWNEEEIKANQEWLNSYMQATVDTYRRVFSSEPTPESRVPLPEEALKRIMEYIDLLDDESDIDVAMAYLKRRKAKLAL